MSAGELTEARGRKPMGVVYQGPIREAEKKIADRLPEIADLVLEMALGRQPEKCPSHHTVLRCPAAYKEPCTYESHGGGANERMLIYAMNRIAGTPTIAGERKVNMEFVQKLAKHITDVFRGANDLPTPDARAAEFAMGIANMWVLIGETADAV